MIVLHENERTKLRTKVKANQEFLKKQNDEVVKPLMQEIKVIEEVKERYKVKYEKNFEDLRILNAIMRLPRMTDQFYKTIKKREQEGIFEERKNQAVTLMGQYVTEKNNNVFFDKFLGHLDKSVPE